MNLRPILAAVTVPAVKIRHCSADIRLETTMIDNDPAFLNWDLVARLRESGRKTINGVRLTDGLPKLSTWLV